MTTNNYKSQLLLCTVALIAMVFAPGTSSIAQHVNPGSGNFYDFGDAPEGALAYPDLGVTGQFPTCINVGPENHYIRHGDSLLLFFGLTVDYEEDGNAGLCPVFSPGLYNQDECQGGDDAGLILPFAYTITGDPGEETVVSCFGGLPPEPMGWYTCQEIHWGPQIDIIVNNLSDSVAYINLLIDWNMDGKWSDSTFCPINSGFVHEHVLVNFEIPANATNELLSTFEPPWFFSGPFEGYVWARFTITPVPVELNWDGSGFFDYGETEDYLMAIRHDPNFSFDFGDAPEYAPAYLSPPTIGYFPTCASSGNAIRHINITLHPDGPTVYFGPSVDYELEGNAGYCPLFAPDWYNMDECFQDGDAGLIKPSAYTIVNIDETLTIVPCINEEPVDLLTACRMAVWGLHVDIDVVNQSDMMVYVNVLVDWNQDGQWGGQDFCNEFSMVSEHVLVNFPVSPNFSGPLSALSPPPFRVGPNAGYVWARFTIAEIEIPFENWDGGGGFHFSFGETEDYLLKVNEFVVPDMGDYGQAPEQSLAYPGMPLFPNELPMGDGYGYFPTCKHIGPEGSFIQHLASPFPTWFGQGVDYEDDGNAGLCPDFYISNNDQCSGGEAGIMRPTPYEIIWLPPLPPYESYAVVYPCGGGDIVHWQTCSPIAWGPNALIDIWVQNQSPIPVYFNFLVDWNRDGQWGGYDDFGGCSVSEHVVENLVIPPTFTGPVSALGLPTFFASGRDGHVWARFSLTDVPVPYQWDGSGIFDLGETEDYLFFVQGPDWDYGDAPEHATAYLEPSTIGSFPTCAFKGSPGHFIRHKDNDYLPGAGMFFGDFVDYESNGNAGFCYFPPYDLDECFGPGDPGLIWPPAYTINHNQQYVPCLHDMTGGWDPSLDDSQVYWIHPTDPGWENFNTIDIWVNNLTSDIAYVNLLIDWNFDGYWGDCCTLPYDPCNEHVLINFPVPSGFYGPLSMLNPPSFPLCAIAAFEGMYFEQYLWIRFSITDVPVDLPWVGTGSFDDGETEDYLIRLIGDGQFPEDLYDYGDAPHSRGVNNNTIAYIDPPGYCWAQFPTCLPIFPQNDQNWIRHGFGHVYLGGGVSYELDGNAGFCPEFNPGKYNKDDDDGLMYPTAYTIQGPVGEEYYTVLGEIKPGAIYACHDNVWGSNIDLWITNKRHQVAYLNVLFDWARDGRWNAVGPTSCPHDNAIWDHVLVDFEIPPCYCGPLSDLAPPAFRSGPNAGHVWARFTITGVPVSYNGALWSGQGDFAYGETEDYLLLVEENPYGDFGDAPDGWAAYPYSPGETPVLGQFPTCLPNGIKHGPYPLVYFGPSVDYELDGNNDYCWWGTDVPYDNDECFQDGDAGLIMPIPFTLEYKNLPQPHVISTTCIPEVTPEFWKACKIAVWGVDVDIYVTNQLYENWGDTAYFNLLIDWNQDGQWGGSVECPGRYIANEHAVVNFPVPPGFSGPLSLLSPPDFRIGPFLGSQMGGYVWARFTITGQEIELPWDGSGIFTFGETEDYLLGIEPGIDSFLYIDDEVFDPVTDTCFEAEIWIIMSNTAVQSGASIVLTAGQFIKLLPNTVVSSGAYFHAYIDTTGVYCDNLKSVLLTQLNLASDDVFAVVDEKNEFFRVYPNPTPGTFTLELTEPSESSTMIVEIFSMLGEKVMGTELPAMKKHVFDIKERQSGLYLIRVMQGDEVGVVKLIKQ